MGTVQRPGGVIGGLSWTTDYEGPAPVGRRGSSDTVIGDITKENEIIFRYKVYISCYLFKEPLDFKVTWLVLISAHSLLQESHSISSNEEPLPSFLASPSHFISPYAARSILSTS